MVDDKIKLKHKLNVQRLTKQREVLFTLFQEHIGKHLHAEEIYQLAKKKLPKINLSTIYRTLKEFKQAKLVDEIHLGEEHHHYELRKHEGHQHMLCTQCMKVIECKTQLLKKLKEEIQREYSFDPYEMQIDITGVCKECRGKKQV